MKNKKILLILFGILILGILMYTLYVARDLVYGPRIELGTSNPYIEVSTQVIEISGKVYKAQELKVNGKSVDIDSDGNFAEKVLLGVGVNTFNFSATDRFGRDREKVLQVVYIPTQGTDVLQLKNR